MATELNTDYTRFTYQDLLEDFTTRLQSDERFRNMSSASIYGMFMEMLASCVDMTNYYMSRTSEEAFIDTARLDSSVIKHGKNLGYNPIRNTPAEAEICIQINGPLPSYLKEGATVYFSQADTKLSFNNNDYILNTDYSYTFTKSEIVDGQSSTWSKTLIYSVHKNTVNYYKLGDYKQYDKAITKPIKVFQGTIVEKTIEGVNNSNKIGKPFQFYDIDDIKFSNWYGKRDPKGFKNNAFYPENSYTKIAIGPTKDTAFSNGIFTIDDTNIYVNEEVLSADGNEIVDSLKVCSITTNSDKSVRLSFGDGSLVKNGLNAENENIYIEYLQTDGANANSIGTAGAYLTNSNKFYATQEGNVIDITSNIQFIFNSDITGGVNFESKESIKINAPAYYAANNKLVTKQDFVSYFKTLTTPIKVQNATAWTVEEIESSDGVDYDKLLNYVFYCIAGQLYNINDKTNSYINVLSDDTYKSGIFTLFGNGENYLNHISDYALLVKNPEKIFVEQYGEPEEEWQKRILQIRENCEHRMMINTKLFAMPPIVQYFDVVGDVKIDSLSKIQETKTEIENKIYAWLNDSCKFNQKIYKSDIFKLFNGYSNVKNVDLDIKVSELLCTDPQKYEFGKFNAENNPKNYVYIAQTGTNLESYEWDMISIPKTDKYGRTITADMFNGQSIIFENGEWESNGIKYNSVNVVKPDVDNITENEERLFIPLAIPCGQSTDVVKTNGQVKQWTFVGEEDDPEIDRISVKDVTMKLKTDFDFTTTSTLDTTNAKNYELESFVIPGDTSNKTVFDALNSWITSCSTISQADRAIDLPYTQGYDMAIGSEPSSTDDPYVRSETIKRRGNTQSDKLDKQVNEHSFWNYFVTDKVYPLFESQIKENQYDNFERFVYDLYAMIKHVLADSILDDNNNIVNYSMANEIPVIRLNIKYN